MPRGRRSRVPVPARRLPPAAVVKKEVEPAVAWHHHLILALAGVSCVALVASLTIAPLSTNDIWIHLKTGELILTQHAVPQKDPYSFTATNHEYLAHEWLSGVAFYLAHRALGVPGLIVVKFAVVLLSAACLLLICRTHRDRLSVVLPAFGLMSYVAAARYIERPHVFSYLFLSIYLFLFFQYRDGNRRRLWLLAVIPLQVLWANLHGGFIQGVLLLAVCAAGEAAAWIRAKYLGVGPQAAVAGADVALLASLPLAAVAVSLINPYGVRLLEFPFRLTGMEVFMEDVFEWKSPFDDAFDKDFAFYGYWVWVMMLFGSFFFVRGKSRVWSSRSTMRRAVDAGLFAGFVVFCYAFIQWQQLLETGVWWWVALSVLFCVSHLDQLDLTEAGIVALMFALSMQHNRGVADAVMVTFPVLTHNLSRILERFQRVPQSPHRSVWARVGGSSPVVVVALSLALLAEAVDAQVSGYRYRPGRVRERGVGVASNIPVCAVDYIVRRGISGNAYTSYGAAALLIFRSYPEVKVSMDSRNDVYGSDLYLEYRATRRSPKAMASYLEKYRVDFFLVSDGEWTPEVTDSLLEGGKWVQVFFDDHYTVLIRDSPRFAPIIAQDTYRVILPGSSRGRQGMRADNAAAYLRESVRAADNCPTAWMPRWYQAQALAVLGQYVDAVAANLEVVARKPDAWFAWAALGVLYAQLDNRRQAIDAFEQALELNPSYQPARDSLRVLREIRDESSHQGTPQRAE